MLNFVGKGIKITFFKKKKLPLKLLHFVSEKFILSVIPVHAIANRTQDISLFFLEWLVLDSLDFLKKVF